jgi:hypothetical protein
MRQVTGSNPIPQQNDVSIRLNSGGHSFSVATLPTTATNADTRIRFVIDTPRVTLVPRTEFSANAATQYLAVCGIEPLHDEVVIAIEGEDDITAVVAINRVAYESISAKLADRAQFTTPLLDNRHPAEHCVTIGVGEGVCYVCYHTAETLRFAEALTIGADDDILYYTTRLFEAESIPLNIPIYINGSRSAAALLKRYFKQVICE